MTVHCGTIPKSGLSGLEILKRIRGFIDYFFGCRYCRDHFVAMASNVANEVSILLARILWKRLTFVSYTGLYQVRKLLE